MNELSEFENLNNHCQGLINVQSDGAFSCIDNVLLIGIEANNYFSGSCTSFNRSTSFEIQDINNVRDFRLFELGYDDELVIIFNEHFIYKGPDQNNTGVLQGNCEHGINWHFSPDIDLRAYLRAGRNVLTTSTIVSGFGESWLKIRL